MAKILTVSRKSHHPIETLIQMMEAMGGGGGGGRRSES